MLCWKNLFCNIFLLQTPIKYLKIMTNSFMISKNLKNCPKNRTYPEIKNQLELRSVMNF